MKNLLVINTILGWSIKCNLMSSKEIINYIDKMIEIFDDIPYEYVETSLVGDRDKHKLESALNELDHLENSIEVTDILLGLVAHRYANKEIDFHTAFKAAFNIVTVSDLYKNERYYPFFYFDDAYSLAFQNIYGDLKDIEDDFKREILNFEDRYDDYLRVMDLSK